MKALVIGGGGFVGPYLVRHLTDDCGYEVTVTKTEKEQLVMDNAVVKNLDILDIGQIVGLLKAEQPDYIFHLAAQSSVAYSWKNPTLTIDVNIKGCVNLLDAVRQLDKKPRVLLIGSGEEYVVNVPPQLLIWWHFLPSLYCFSGVFRHHFSILMALSATMAFFSLI